MALFAALSYAVTQSTRSSGSNNNESSNIIASQISQYGAGIVVAITRMIISGVDETELCFYTGNNHTDYNHASCANPDNLVFSSSGGGASYIETINNANDGTPWEFTSRPQVYGQGTTVIGGGVGEDEATDLVMILRGMNLEVCQKINEKISLSGIPIDSGNLNVDRFDGVYLQNDNLDGCPANCATLGGSPFVQSGVHTGCFEEGDTGDYIYFHTLIAR